jgi:hypothetical protein
MSAPTTPTERERQTGTNLAALLLGWAFVGLPLAWGVAQTVIKSLALFHQAP